jgi:hypothetical protein
MSMSEMQPTPLVWPVPLPLQARDPLITLIPETHTGLLQDGAVNPEQPIRTASSYTKRDTYNALGWLAKMYLSTGPGVHSLEALAEAGVATSGEATRVSECLRYTARDLIATVEQPHTVVGSPKALVFSGMRFASRHQTIEEKEADEAAAAQRRLSREQQRTEVIDLTQFDRAVVTVRGEVSHLPLSTPTNLLMARLLERLAALQKAQLSRGWTVAGVAKKVWELMSDTERSLFKDAGKEKAASTAIVPEIRKLLFYTCLPRGLISRGRSASDSIYMEFRSGDVGIEYQKDAPEVEEGKAQQLFVINTGGFKEVPLNGPVDPDRLAQAGEYVAMVKAAGSGIISQDMSIRVLTFIMNKDNAPALRKALADAGYGDKLTEQAAMIDALLVRSLTRSSYWLAVKERLIGGFHSGAAQVGGRLPDVTRRHIGVRSDMAQAREEQRERLDSSE